MIASPLGRDFAAAVTSRATTLRRRQEARVSSRDMNNRPLLMTALGSAAVTALIAGVPYLRFAYDNASLHVALETAEGLIAVLLAFLAIGRYRVTRRRDDLVLGLAFAVLAATNLFLSVGPNVAVRDRAVGFATWAGVGLRLTGATGIAVAAALGDRTVPRNRLRHWLLGGAGVVISVLALAVIADRVLDEPIDPSVDASASNRPTLIGHPLLLTFQGVGVAVFAFAARRFAQRFGRVAMDVWLAAGCILAAFSRVHYLLFSSLYTSWVSTGDVLRLASYLAFLTGAAFEIRSSLQARTALAAADERARIARDLHDGLAQELSFIRSQTVGGGLDDARAELVSDAAGRALLESRRLIRVLSSDARPIEDDLIDALAVVTRAGIAIDVRVDGPGVDAVGPSMQAAIVGIAREASGNAVRHGRPERVSVVLEVGAGAASGCLEVRDDGSGFDPALPSDGFGVQGMRERAGTIAATLDVTSARGAGTVVTVRW
jgi:signal transduction histidine kinase